MNKTEMLDMIDNLTVCLQGPSETTVSDLVASQLRWKDIDDLKAFYDDMMFKFYMAHEKDFREDYYWEFCVVD